MHPALKTQIERQLFRDRQAILKTDDGEAVGAVDAVLELVAADQTCVVRDLSFNSDLRFAS